MTKKKTPPKPFNHLLRVPWFVPSCDDLEVITDEFQQYIIEVSKVITNKKLLNEYIQTCASLLLTAWYENQRVLIIGSNAELSDTDDKLNEWKQMERLLEAHGMLMDDNARAILVNGLSSSVQEAKFKHPYRKGGNNSVKARGGFTQADFESWRQAQARMNEQEPTTKQFSKKGQATHLIKHTSKYGLGDYYFSSKYDFRALTEQLTKTRTPKRKHVKKT